MVERCPERRAPKISKHMSPPEQDGLLDSFRWKMSSSVLRCIKILVESNVELIG